MNSSMPVSRIVPRRCLIVHIRLDNGGELHIRLRGLSHKLLEYMSCLMEGFPSWQGDGLVHNSMCKPPRDPCITHANTREDPCHNMPLYLVQSFVFVHLFIITCESQVGRKCVARSSTIKRWLISSASHMKHIKILRRIII